MAYIPRLIESQLLAASRSLPALILTGPRRSEKTTLLRKLFPRASYYLLEDPDVVARVGADPNTFLEDLRGPAIPDEIQNAPQILNYIRTRIDRSPRRIGRWFLTGSQDAPLMKEVTESMAGRAAVSGLLPISLLESPEVTLRLGGFPEVLARPSSARIWFSSYVQPYLERGVRTISSIRDLATFRRFLMLLATRSGRILNRTDLDAPLGVPVPTITEWLNILGATGQAILVPPFLENFGKRLIKSPKVYFVDPGLLCYLLGIESGSTLNRSPFLGALFETLVASEIVKTLHNTGSLRALYYFRDHQGLEVDFVVPRGDRRLFLIEAKASRTVTPQMGESLARRAKATSQYNVDCLVVHRAPETTGGGKALRLGVRSSSLESLLTQPARR